MTETRPVKAEWHAEETGEREWRGGGDGEMRAAATAAVVAKWQNGGQDYQGEAVESAAPSISGNHSIFHVILILENGARALFSRVPFFTHVFRCLFFHAALP